MNLDLTYEWVTIMSNKQSLAIGTSNTAVDACSRVGLEVNVLYTTTKATLSALRVARKLAHDLGARIRVIVPQVFPFPLELSRPPVKPEFTARRVCTMVSTHAIETEIQICLCREKLDAPLSTLEPNSIVVVGGKKRFWRTQENLSIRINSAVEINLTADQCHLMAVSFAEFFQTLLGGRP